MFQAAQGCQGKGASGELTAQRPRIGGGGPLTLGGAAPQRPKAAIAAAEHTAGGAEGQGVAAAGGDTHDVHAAQVFHHPGQLHLQCKGPPGQGHHF